MQSVKQRKLFVLCKLSFSVLYIFLNFLFFSATSSENLLLMSFMHVTENIENSSNLYQSLSCFYLYIIFFFHACTVYPSSSMCYFNLYVFYSLRGTITTAPTTSVSLCKPSFCITTLSLMLVYTYFLFI